MTEKSTSIFEKFAGIVKEHPTKDAIYFPVNKQYRPITYIELYYQSIKLGNLLASRGVKAQDKVAILLPNQIEWPIAFLAIQYINAVAVPLDVKFPFREIRQLILHSGAKIIVCQEKIAVSLKVYLKEVTIVEVIAVDSKETSDKLSLISQKHEEKSVSLDNPAAIFYTSGTTSLPKGVVLSHKNLLSNVQSIHELGIANPEDVIISVLPLHHVYPFMVTCLLPLLEGAHISYSPSIGSEDLLRCVRETGVTALVGVPQLFSFLESGIKQKLNGFPSPVKFLLKALVEACWIIRKTTGINLNRYLLADLHNKFGPTLRFFVSGGARLEPKVIQNLHRWGFTVLEGYGLTETAPIIALNPPEKPRIGSVGKPIPEVTVKIHHPDNKGVGEIAVSGPNLMLGYYRLPEETEKRMYSGWFMTGDLGRLDDEGYLYICGRKDEVIVLSSGKKVDPEVIEKHYAVSPFIKEVCVIASEGSGFAEGAKQLTAVVVPNEEQLRAHGHLTRLHEKIKWELDNLSRSLHAYQRVKGFVISEETFPRTALGKLVRHKIAEKYGNVPVTARKKDEFFTEDELSLLSDATCKKLLDYLSARLKREVNLSDHLELDLGLDSLGRMELLLEIQNFLKIEISEEKAMDLFYANTVEELLLKAQPLFPPAPWKK